MSILPHRDRVFSFFLTFSDENELGLMRWILDRKQKFRVFVGLVSAKTRGWEIDSLAPNDTDIILTKDIVFSYNSKIFCQRLSNYDAVKRVSMVKL